MPRQVPKTFGSRAEPRPVTGEPPAHPSDKPPGFSEAPQPMISEHPIVRSFDNPEAIPIFAPHRPERPEKSEGGIPFRIVSEFEPKGDQPEAIRELVEGIETRERDQVLLGVTGSGKTFTMAKVIEETQRPALILAPNKTLAALLFGEF